MNYSNLLYNHFLSNVENKHDYIYMAISRGDLPMIVTL